MFNFNDEKILIKSKGRDISFKELKKLISPYMYALKHSNKDKLLISTDDNFEFILYFLSGIFAGKEIVLLADKTKISDFGEDCIKTIDKIEDYQDITTEVPKPENININFYTSGSTGSPKTVKKTLKSLILEAETLNKQFLIPEGIPFVTTAKMEHMFGFTFAFMFPFVSGRIVDTDVIKFPEQIKKEMFVFISTPSFLDKMAKYGNNPNPPEYIFSAGDKLANKTFEFFEKKSKVVDIYGSTESGIIAYRTSSKDEYLTPFDGVKIISSDDNNVILQSPYFDENELVLGDKIIELGRKFKIAGRSDRILKIQEKRISAVELENYLNNNEFIEDSYCMKIGGKVAAVVVLTHNGKEQLLKDGNIVMIKNLKAYVKNFCSIVPQKWRFLFEIPKTTAGKIDKDKLIAIFNKNISVPLIFNKELKDKTVLITLAFLKSSNFFKGHFPAVAILPGVVQLLFAHYLAEDVFGIQLNYKRIKKIKFSSVIKPDRKVILKLQNNDLSVDFTFTDGEKTFSSGTFIK